MSRFADIAERIITAHGSTIVVASSASDSATFTVNLPREVDSSGR